MSLKPTPIQPVPEETIHVAKAAFPKGNLYLTLRDKLGTIFQDEDFAELFPIDGQPALPPWRLALVTILQFRENLSDRQASETVRARIDWKYLLGLELTDPGFWASFTSAAISFSRSSSECACTGCRAPTCCCNMSTSAWSRKFSSQPATPSSKTAASGIKLRMRIGRIGSRVLATTCCMKFGASCSSLDMTGLHS